MSVKRTVVVSITPAATTCRSASSVATETTRAPAAANRNRLSAFVGPGAPATPVIVASASASHVAARTEEPVAAVSSPRISPQTAARSCIGTGIATTTQPTVWKSAFGRTCVSKPA